MKAQAAPARRVLMVDREPQIHRLIALLLGDGYQVDGARDADQALGLVHDTPYDVVLVDEDLPGAQPGGGFDLLRRVRRAAPDLSLILFSADARVEKAVEAMRAGAHDYLRKTVSASELRGAVERAAERGNLAREVRRLRSEVERARGLGQLIGNSDMHDGNLSFLPGLRLAPVYDMLPMLYAPERGVELPERVFQPPLPTPAERPAWQAALPAARVFWRRAAADARLTDGFRALCERNAGHLGMLDA